MKRLKRSKEPRAIAKWPIPEELKRRIDVEAGGRGMSLLDFADYVWKVYVDHRPDMVLQREDGTVELVPVKRPQQTPRRPYSNNERTIVRALERFWAKYPAGDPLRKTALDLLKSDEAIVYNHDAALAAIEIFADKHGPGDPIRKTLADLVGIDGRIISGTPRTNSESATINANIGAH